jgi:hypothetical protein
MSSLYFQSRCYLCSFYILSTIILYSIFKEIKIYSTVHDVEIHSGENLLLYPPYIGINQYIS